MHARSLIKFYRCSKRHDTDIVLGDFGIPKIESAVDTELEGYERPIEVRLLYLTDFRNPDYRNSHSPDRGTTIRQDWDREVRVIAEKLIFDCLRHASERSGDWQRPFKSLLDATEGGYGDKSYPWPKCLGEKSDVENYLKSLGILARQTSPP